MIYHVALILQMSDIVGFDIRPQPETSLMQMMEYGLTKHLDRSLSWSSHLFYWLFSIPFDFLPFRLEEIGAAAAKEYSLEKALEKMKFEWKGQKFEFIAYRDTVSHYKSLSDRTLQKFSSIFF